MDKKFDIEYTIEDRISQIENQISKSENNKSSSFISNFPKLVMFEKLFLFLEYDEINRIASTCRNIRTTIFSSYGIKLISHCKLQDNLFFVKSNIIDKINIVIKEIQVKSHDNSKQQTQLDALKDAKTSQVDAEAFNTLKKYVDEKSKDMEKQIEASEISKQQISIELEELRAQNSELNEVVNEHKQTLRDLNMRYQNLLIEKQKEVNEFVSQNEDLKAHRKLLAEEVISLRDMLERSEKEKLKFFDCLVSINKVIS